MRPRQTIFFLLFLVFSASAKSENNRTDTVRVKVMTTNVNLSEADIVVKSTLCPSIIKEHKNNITLLHTLYNAHKQIKGQRGATPGQLSDILYSKPLKIFSPQITTKDTTITYLVKTELFSNDSVLYQTTHKFVLRPYGLPDSVHIPHKLGNILFCKPKVPEIAILKLR